MAMGHGRNELLRRRHSKAKYRLHGLQRHGVPAPVVMRVFMQEPSTTSGDSLQHQVFNGIGGFVGQVTACP